MAPTSPEPELIVISGPSGSGKSTILKKLFDKYPDRFGFSVSHTTRSPRNGETDGKDYHFVAREKFQSLVKENQFLEHAQFGSNLYGTSLGAVKAVQDTGKTCILDIEMEGVKQVKSVAVKRKEEGGEPLKARFLFLQPPSVEILEKRLRGRGTDKEEAIVERLKQAEVEMEYARQPGAHDKIVVNDDLERAWGEVEEFIVGREG